VLPIVLEPASTKVGLAGAGEGLARRAAMLIEAGVEPVPVPADADKGALAGLQVLFIAGLDQDASTALAGQARAAGVLVNAEDQLELCDFHVPAILRRGDMVLTASTGGRAPGLARRLREWLENRFGPEWHDHLEDVSAARALWRADGVAPAEVSRRTRDLITEKGWLS
jgi:precorrin-2 dehydrogenase/sirohydrochlorin ferrochelatase